MASKLKSFVWKWRIALACGVLHFLHWGLMRTRTFLFVGSIERFNINRKEASFPYVLCSIITHLCGPLAGYLGSRYGLQRVTMFGCILSSVAVGSCFFAENILDITILFGILVGIGNGLAGPLTPSIISNYYKNNMSTANGIASTGSAIGIFLYSPLFKFALSEYTVSGTYLIIAALWLNAIPAVLFMKDVQEEKSTHMKNKQMQNNDREKIWAKQCLMINTAEEQSKIDHCSKGSEYFLENRFISCTKTVDKDVIQITDSVTDSNEPTSDTDTSNSDTNEEEVPMLPKHSVTDCVNIDSQTQKQNIEKYSDIYSSDLQNTLNKPENTCIQTEEFSKPFLRLPEEPTSYIHDATHLHSRSLENASNLRTNEAAYVSKEVETFIIEQTPQENECSHLQDSVKQTECIDPCLNFLSNSTKTFTHDPEKTITDQQRTQHQTWHAFSIFLNPLFLLVAFTQGSFLALMTLQATISADYFRDKGLDLNQISVLIMATAIGDICGRFSLGWITDKKYMTVINFAALCYTVYGLTFTLNAQSEEFYGLLFSNILGTVVIGALMAVTPSIVFQYFQGKTKTMAMSSRFILFVPISATISPLIGLFREQIGSYEGLFYAVTVYCIVNSGLLLIMPVVAKHISKRRKTTP